MKNISYLKRIYGTAISLLTIIIVNSGCSLPNIPTQNEKSLQETEQSRNGEQTEEQQEQQTQEQQIVKDENGYQWLSETVFNYEFGDLDDNGVVEYIQVDWSNEAPDFDSKYTIYWNGNAIYESNAILIFSPGKAEYLDLDHDGENEIFFPFYSRVNSMPLEEYIVLKQYDSEWKPLEMIHGETIMDNAFPVTITKGASKWSVVISCGNLDKEIVYDLEQHYQELKKEMETAEENEYYNNLNTFYEEIVTYPEGEACGSTSAWGIWEICSGEYEGKTCLIASHGLEGYDKFDFWGTLDVYFDYDAQGNTRFLNIQLQ